MAITTFKVIQGHRFEYQSKARIRLPIRLIPIYLLLCTVSKLRLIIGLCQIFANDNKALQFNALAVGDTDEVIHK